MARAVNLCFTFPFCPPPLFPSGVQRYHQVLREGETAETLPTQPVQVSLLWNLWQSVKRGPREDRPWAHNGLTQPPWTELKLSSFYLFPPPCPQPRTPPSNPHRAPPPPPDLRTSACLLFQLDGGQNVGNGQDRGQKEVAEQTGPDSGSFLAKLAPSQTWVLKRPGKRQA